jgi:hypothetical protein
MRCDRPKCREKVEADSEDSWRWLSLSICERFGHDASTWDVCSTRCMQKLLAHLAGNGWQKDEP